jgi:YgiT-type zinc finger domain-containing protein
MTSRQDDVELLSKLTRCFHCGGTELEVREVEELLAVDQYVVRCRVPGSVCLRCGERYFAPATVSWFDEIRTHVRVGDLSGLRATGAVLEPAA